MMQSETIPTPRRWRPLGIFTKAELEPMIIDLKNRADEWQRLSESDREIVERARVAFAWLSMDEHAARVLVFLSLANTEYRVCILDSCDAPDYTPLNQKEVGEFTEYAIAAHETALNPTPRRPAIIYPDMN